MPSGSAPASRNSTALDLVIMEYIKRAGIFARFTKFGAAVFVELSVFVELLIYRLNFSI